MQVAAEDRHDLEQPAALCRPAILPIVVVCPMSTLRLEPTMRLEIRCTSSWSGPGSWTLSTGLRLSGQARRSSRQAQDQQRIARAEFDKPDPTASDVEKTKQCPQRAEYLRPVLAWPFMGSCGRTPRAPARSIAV